MYFEGRCRVCRSPHRQEYEEMRLKENPCSLREIQEYAREKYGEEFSWSGIQKHFQRHVMKNLAFNLALDKKYQEKASRDFQVIEQISRSLNIAQEVAEHIVKNPDKLEDPKQIQALRGMLSEIRQTLEVLTRLRTQMTVEPVEGKKKVLTVLLRVLEDLPPNLVDVVLKKVREELANEYSREGFTFD